MAVMTLARVAVLLAIAAVGSACKARPDVYTLYRTETVGDSARIHVATFDAAEEGDDNRATCEHTRELFQLQPSMLSRFWCEKGRYREKASK